MQKKIGRFYFYGGRNSGIGLGFNVDQQITNQQIADQKITDWKITDWKITDKVRFIQDKL